MGPPPRARTVPVFDDDGDGKLSFHEFRLTNFANQASDWWQLKDLDNDGRIAWPEFYREKPPLLIAQSRFYFDRYDRNKDGFLSALEFTSEADPRNGNFWRTPTRSSGPALGSPIRRSRLPVE